ncbi:DMT family transporter [Streptomyces sp. NPDC002004]
MRAFVPVLFALGAALCNAVATVLQRRAALGVPRSDHFRLGLLLDLMRTPIWLGGILAVIAAAVCQAFALATGPLTVVQPLFVLELPLALVVASFVLHRRMPLSGWIAVACVVVGLGVALAAASPSGNRTHVPIDRWLPALVACCGVIVLLSAVALKRPEGRARAACLATASAIAYALTAALMKTSTHILDVDGLPGFLTAWQTYGFAVAGVGALLLLQHALQAGPLVASQPALTLGDALVSLALGVTLYDEQVHTGWRLAPQLLGVALIAVGAVGLARTPLTRTLVADDAEPVSGTGTSTSRSSR